MCQTSLVHLYICALMGVNRPGEMENPQLGKDESICFWNINMLANRDVLGRTDQ